jgi:hypothetical protein
MAFGRHSRGGRNVMEDGGIAGLRTIPCNQSESCVYASTHTGKMKLVFETRASAQRSAQAAIKHRFHRLSKLSARFALWRADEYFTNGTRGYDTIPVRMRPLTRTPASPTLAVNACTSMHKALFPLSLFRADVARW